MQRPNFEMVKKTWTVKNTPLYGDLIYESFGSYDGETEYLLARDTRGTLWIVGKDIINAPIRPSGIRGTSLDIGLLELPPYDYAEEVGMEIEGARRNGKYVDITGVIHNHLPLFQEFRRVRGLD